MTEELKPCPFCPDGGRPEMIDTKDAHFAKAAKEGRDPFDED